MKKQDQGRIPRQIIFTTKLNELAKKNAENLGVTVPEYVKFLILQDSKTQLHRIEELSEEDDASVARGLADYANGNFTTLKTKQDITDHLAKLAREQ